MANNNNGFSKFIKNGVITRPEAKKKVIEIINSTNVDDNVKDDLIHLGKCAIDCGNPTLFPNIKVSRAKNDDPDEYIKKWINKYINALANKPSDRVATLKQSVDDPILKTMIKAEKNFNDRRVDMALDDHNLYMDAENIQGNLLEEYIDEHISKYGWIWAEGESIRACDFIKYDSDTDEYILLQIKNKYNSENSSSSAIRTGTKIKKWFRLNQRTVNKHKVPYYEWDKLNEIIGHDDEMSESDYKEFITRVARKNKNLLI